MWLNYGMGPLKYICMCGLIMGWVLSSTFTYVAVGIATNSAPLIKMSLSLLFSLRHLVEEFEMMLSAGSKSHNIVKAVDTKFRKSIQEQQVRYSKVREIEVHMDLFHF